MVMIIGPHIVTNYHDRLIYQINTSQDVVDWPNHWYLLDLQLSADWTK